MEIIRSYPGFMAILVQRVAHTLYEAGASEYARELTEYAKTETGIDIHPGAEIGDYFFIDHGTGVVIGETTTVGEWVRLYQDVTLGALHFEADESDEHRLKKGYKRHPDIGDHVVIGAGTKVLALSPSATTSASGRTPGSPTTFRTRRKCTSLTTRHRNGNEPNNTATVPHVLKPQNYTTRRTNGPDWCHRPGNRSHRCCQFSRQKYFGSYRLR